MAGDIAGARASRPPSGRKHREKRAGRPRSRMLAKTFAAIMRIAGNRWHALDIMSTPT